MSTWRSAPNGSSELRIQEFHPEGEPAHKQGSVPFRESDFQDPRSRRRLFENVAYHPLLRNVQLKGPLVLIKNCFPRGLSFVNVTFHEDVNFQETTFDGPAYFWNCRFKKEFSFFRVRVTGKCHPVEKREQGEVNFSYCRFDQGSRKGLRQPSFDRATFEGVCFFHRTVFFNGVSMEEVRFTSGAQFDGFLSDICIHRSQLPTLDKDKLEPLYKEAPRVLSINTDHEDHFNFDSNIRSLDSLSRNLLRSLTLEDVTRPLLDTGYERSLETLRHLLRRLTCTRDLSTSKLLGTSARSHYGITPSTLRAETPRTSSTAERPQFDQSAKGVSKAPLEPRQLARIRALWKRGYRSEMFGRPELGDTGPTSSFQRTQFGEKSLFAHVNLSSCLFQGAEISTLAFKVVTWDRQPSGLFVRKLTGFRRNLRAHPRLRFTFRFWPYSIEIPLIRSWRLALRDEIELDRRMARVGGGEKTFVDRRTELSEMYREIRIASDRERDSQTARDFYFGELEAERLSHGWVRRNLGLSHLYKIFSGYSKREGLALTWLFAFIFILFPLIFLFWINWQEFQKLSVPPLSWISRSNGYSCHVVLTNGSPGINFVTAHGETKRPPHDQDEDDLFKYTLNTARASVWGSDTGEASATPFKAWRRNWYHSSVRAVTDSLQASTFYASATEDHAVDTAIQTLHSVKCVYDADDKEYPKAEETYRSSATFLSGRQHRRSLVQALERLFVPAQLGLFLLALRSKFQRSH